MVGYSGRSCRTKGQRQSKVIIGHCESKREIQKKFACQLYMMEPNQGCADLKSVLLLGLSYLIYCPLWFLYILIRCVSELKKKVFINYN